MPAISTQSASSGGRVVHDGGGFADNDPAVPDGDKIGERAADIDADRLPSS
jgi:hypothetical protein